MRGVFVVCDSTVEIDKDTFDKLMKLTKKELIEKFCIAAIDARVSQDRAKDLQASLAKAEGYVEQGRTMLTAIMEQWYDYAD